MKTIPKWLKTQLFDCFDYFGRQQGVISQYTSAHHVLSWSLLPEEPKWQQYEMPGFTSNWAASLRLQSFTSLISSSKPWGCLENISSSLYLKKSTLLFLWSMDMSKIVCLEHLGSAGFVSQILDLKSDPRAEGTFPGFLPCNFFTPGDRYQCCQVLHSSAHGRRPRNTTDVAIALWMQVCPSEKF